MPTIRWTAVFVSLVAVVFAQGEPKEPKKGGPPSLTMPAGQAPTVDGKIGDDEWRGAAVFTVGRGDEVYGQAWMRRHERQLYIAFKSEFTPYSLGVRFSFADPLSGSEGLVLVTPLNPPRSPISLFRKLPDRGATQMSADRCDVRFDLMLEKGFTFEVRVPLDLLEVARSTKKYHFHAEVWDLELNKMLAWYPIVVEGQMGGRGNAILGPEGDWGADVPATKRSPVNQAIRLLEKLEAEAISGKGQVLRAFTGSRDGQRKDAPLEELEASLTQLVAKHPGYLSLRANLMRVLRGRNRFREALALLETIPRDFPIMRHNIFNGFAKIELHYALGEYEVGLAFAEKNTELFGPDEIERMRRVFGGLARNWKIEQQMRKRDAERNLPRVLLKTPRGEIILELFEDDAPNAVANFITLVENGFYDGTRFHWVAGGERVFGGDPNSRDGDPYNDGYGDPGYLIESQPNRRLQFPFTVAYTDKRLTKRTEGCNFIIHITPLPELDGSNTVFGRVIKGEDVVKQLEYYDKIDKAKVLRKRDHAYKVVKR